MLPAELKFAFELFCWRFLSSRFGPSLARFSASRRCRCASRSSSRRESDCIVTGAKIRFMSIVNSISQLVFVAKVSSPSALTKNSARSGWRRSTRLPESHLPLPLRSSMMRNLMSPAGT